MKNLFVIISVLVSFISTAVTGQVEITDLKPTPFFPKTETGESLKQIVQVSVKNSTGATKNVVDDASAGQTN